MAVKKMAVLFVASLIYSFSFQVYGNSFYHAELQMNDKRVIPFTVYYEGSEIPILKIINGKETIELKHLFSKNDSLHFEFPQIAGKIVFSKTSLRGYWVNLNKTNPLIFPFSFYKSVHNSIHLDQEIDSNINLFMGTYSVTFNDDTGTEPAIGIFNQSSNNEVHGTFRTETGDYRFLCGGAVNGLLRLSCFDGVHAFLFELSISDSGELSGDFYSGAKYHATIQGKKNEFAGLRSPYEISFPIVKNDKLSIVVINSKGKKTKLNYKNFKGKPTIIQIMGSWCPNCLDETQYFQSIKSQPQFKNLNIYGVSFENGIDTKNKLERMMKFAQKTHINYPVFLGGGASAKEASQVFHQLNGIYSFPTTLYLNKKGEIIKVHSGFDGPGTGLYYEAFKKDTEKLLLELLNE